MPKNRPINHRQLKELELIAAVEASLKSGGVLTLLLNYLQEEYLLDLLRLRYTAANTEHEVYWTREIDALAWFKHFIEVEIPLMKDNLANQPSEEL